MGKSLTAAKLAWQYQRAGKYTAVVFADGTVPMLPCIVREEELVRKRSIGSIFAAKMVTAELVFENRCTLKGEERLSLYGFLKGEHAFTYPTPGEVQAKEMLTELKAQFDVVVADCSGVLTDNLFSVCAIKEADSIVGLHGCDFKSLSFYSSSHWYLEKFGIDASCFYKVISNVKDENRMRRMYHKPAFWLPYSNEVERQYLAGDLFRDLEYRESSVYLDHLTQLAEELIS